MAEKMAVVEELYDLTSNEEIDKIPLKADIM